MTTPSAVDVFAADQQNTDETWQGFPAAPGVKGEDDAQTPDDDGRPRAGTSAVTPRRPALAGVRGKADSRALVRRTAQKTVDIAAAPAAQRKILAGLFGCPDEVAHLATEVMCAGRGATGAISDLEEVAAADPMEAGVIVASWDRPRSNALWSLLADMGAVKGSRPPQDAKAAIAIARAALGLSDADRRLLAGVVSLIRNRKT